MTETITLNEIKALIIKEKIEPSKLFGMDALTEDPTVKGIIKKAIAGEYLNRKELDKSFDKARQEWEEKEKKFIDENKKLKIEGTKVKAADLFGTKIKERKIDDKQTKFVEAKKGSFTLEDPDNLDKEVDKFIDTALEEYKETAKIFGHKTEEKKEEQKGGGEPVESGRDDSLIPD